MKNKSVFFKVICLAIIAIVCIFLTVTIALLAGSVEKSIFDFKNLNYGNVIPFLLIGIFISCAIIGIGVLFVSKSVFEKVKDYLDENKNQNDKK